MIITVTPNTTIDRVLVVPDFAVGQVRRARLSRVQPAGKGINVSRVLARLGVASLATGFVGRAEEPLYRDSFASDPVDVQLVPIDSPTRANVTIRDPATPAQTHLREQGPHVSRNDWSRLLHTLNRAATENDVVVFAGSLPPGLDGPDLAHAVRHVKACGSRVAVDCSGEALRLAIAEGPWLLKPNRSELAELAGRPIHSVEEAIGAARELLGSVQIVLASLGADGLALATPGGAWAARVAVAEVRNTVGPGDAALAGFLAADQHGEPPQDALLWAAACGAASVEAEVAGLIDPEFVEQHRRSATVTVVH